MNKVIIIKYKFEHPFRGSNLYPFLLYFNLKISTVSSFGESITIIVNEFFLYVLVDYHIKFTNSTEKDESLPFLDTFVTQQVDGKVKVSVYRKPTHMDHHLPFELQSVRIQLPSGEDGEGFLQDIWCKNVSVIEQL